MQYYTAVYKTLNYLYDYNEIPHTNKIFLMFNYSQMATIHNKILAINTQ
jgi:hypothetical protein